jgi:WXG100 family type VII secretion target
MAQDVTAVNFGKMKAASGSFIEAFRELNATLEELDSELEGHLAEWDGSARTAYDRIQQDWNRVAARMAQIVDHLGTGIGEAHDIHKEADNYSIGLWQS